MSKILTEENFKGEDTMLSIENIIVDRDLQPREDLTEVKAFAKDVAETIKNGGQVPRVLVVRITEALAKDAEGKPLKKPGGGNVKPGDYLVGGNRRLMGYELADRSKIPVTIREGTYADCMDVASSSNIGNLALPRRPEDKRRAVAMCLLAHWDWSDRTVSSHVQVSDDMVAKMRPSIEKLLPKDVVEQNKDTRVDKRGRRQPVKKKTGRGKPNVAVSGKTADWVGFEARYAWLVKFVEHLGELDGRKTKEHPFQKAHGFLSKYGETMKAWLDEFKKGIKEPGTGKPKPAAKATAKPAEVKTDEAPKLKLADAKASEPVESK